MDQVLQKLDDLEMKISFQDHTIEELNQQVILLNELVSRQQHQLRMLVNKLQAMEPSNMASPSEETPPPHY